MEGYRRSPGVAPGDIQSAARETLDEAGAFLRRLIPFPGTEGLSPLSLLPRTPQDGAASPKAVTAAADIVGFASASARTFARRGARPPHRPGPSHVPPEGRLWSPGMRADEHEAPRAG